MCSFWSELMKTSSTFLVYPNPQWVVLLLVTISGVRQCLFFSISHNSIRYSLMLQCRANSSSRESERESERKKEGGEWPFDRFNNGRYMFMSWLLVDEDKSMEQGTGEREEHTCRKLVRFLFTDVDLFVIDIYWKDSWCPSFLMYDHPHVLHKKISTDLFVERKWSAKEII